MWSLTHTAGGDYNPDYSGPVAECVLSSFNTFCEYHIEIVDDFVAENDEYFSILLESRDPLACVITNADVNTAIIIKDDGIIYKINSISKMTCPFLQRTVMMMMFVEHGKYVKN